MATSAHVYASHPGVNAYQNQEFVTAKDEFKKELNNRPNSGKLLYNLGNAYYKNGEYNKAIQAYEESLNHLSKQKNKINALYNIGTAQLSNQNLAESLRPISKYWI